MDKTTAAQQLDLYTFSVEINLYISCPRIMENRIIGGIGIIHIGSECQVKTGNILIRRFKILETIIYREIKSVVKL